MADHLRRTPPSRTDGLGMNRGGGLYSSSSLRQHFSPASPPGGFLASWCVTQGRVDRGHSILPLQSLHPGKSGCMDVSWCLAASLSLKEIPPITLCQSEPFALFFHLIKISQEQKKRHRCIGQTFGLCGRRRGWDVSREQHQNMFII